jgi:hypothetical protein
MSEMDVGGGRVGAVFHPKSFPLGTGFLELLEKLFFRDYVNRIFFDDLQFFFDVHVINSDLRFFTLFRMTRASMSHYSRGLSVNAHCLAFCPCFGNYSEHRFCS